MKLRSLIVCAMISATAIADEPQKFSSPETRVGLLELYTSEGCSSCPPAEAWLGKLRTSPQLWKGVVPVAFHVDYWDRLGWPDRFAKAEFTERQHRYAERWSSQSVYTPGFALNGEEWRGWFDQKGALPPSGKGGKVGVLSIVMIGASKVIVTFIPTGETPVKLHAEVALIGGDVEVDVKRGENAGRKLRHEFVALETAAAEMKKEGDSWIGTVNLPGKHTGAPATAIAAWVSTGDSQPTIQATGGWLRKP